MLRNRGRRGHLASKVWRIGLMGYSSNPGNVLYCLSALEAVLGSMGVALERGAAAAAAEAQFNRN